MSFWELLIIVIVAMIVIKPERLPEIAYTLGRWVAKLRKFYQKFVNQSHFLP